ncbi:hypothetical protein AKJ16_DCAP07067 [Drosera capensis]
MVPGKILISRGLDLVLKVLMSIDIFWKIRGLDISDQEIDKMPHLGFHKKLPLFQGANLEQVDLQTCHHSWFRVQTI